MLLLLLLLLSSPPGAVRDGPREGRREVYIIQTMVCAHCPLPLFPCALCECLNTGMEFPHTYLDRWPSGGQDLNDSVLANSEETGGVTFNYPACFEGTF
ncbi:hypothetical protein BZA05DRAFT_115852 [Tricharina praecox]|uniref:uncharacterized protein n=1 Tax=Tricharina praecox TaxID=43433 RepID=UPI002220E3FB|nr:uncharacterized protein BZA05DRAFT_115852 [Tricharina praecox]KAI5858122.1 hypothetical protein BZA05DRAFT_115852 [Tricharina praecox]